jgi:hypothetical protein
VYRGLSVSLRRVQTLGLPVELKAAVSLHFAHYNFVRMHKTLLMTPAMAAGVESKLWSLEELVDLTTT